MSNIYSQFIPLILVCWEKLVLLQEVTMTWDSLLKQSDPMQFPFPGKFIATIGFDIYLCPFFSFWNEIGGEKNYSGNGKHDKSWILCASLKGIRDLNPSCGLWHVFVKSRSRFKGLSLTRKQNRSVLEPIPLVTLMICVNQLNLQITKW